MSENHRFYLQKMAQRRQSPQADRPLRAHLEEMLGVVRECEARWALEDRIDRRLGLGYCEWLRTRTMAAVQSTAPLINSTHIVQGMSENWTRAPKMHIAAAPASRKEPGISSHAE